MKKEVSIFRFYGSLAIIALIALGCIIAGLDIIATYQNFQIQSTEMLRTYNEEQKQIIKREVEHVVERITRVRSRLYSNAEQNLKQHVEKACSIAENIYIQFKDLKSETEIKQIIMTALRPIRFDDGDGYYFIDSLTGTNILYPTEPVFEGQNIIDLQDSRGNYIVRQELELLKSKGEGLVTGYWPKPDSDNQEDYEKITFVKLFRPYNWSIGTGLYVDDAQTRMKTRLLEEISAIRYGPDQNGYIFVVSYNGTTLMNDTQRNLIGKNIWDLTDPNGIKVIQEERRAVENPMGDYIYYSWEKPSTGQISPKVSFMKGIPEWEWMIGAGTYLDDIENDIAVLQTKLLAQLKKTILNVILAVFASVGLFILLFTWLNSKLKKDLDIFTDFFDQASHSDKKIDQKWVRFSEFRRLAGYANDMVTEKASTQQHLSENRAKLLQAQYIAKIGDFTWNIETGSVTWSEGMYHLLKYEKDETIDFAKVNVDIQHPDDLERVTQWLKDSIASGKTILTPNEYRLICKDGEMIYVHTEGRIEFEDGKPVTLTGTCQDITERKRVEEVLQKAEKLRSVGILAGGIAHDFNNILMGLFGNISMAKEELPDNHPCMAFLDNAENAMTRASLLTNRLLTFSKGGDPVKGNISISKLIEEVIFFDLSGSNVKAIFSHDENLWQAHVDHGQIQQVFSNLAINANEAMPDGGHLYINIQNADITKETIPELNPGKYIKITIRDEGTGIPQENLTCVFDPYFSTKQSGNGLGLFTTYSIISKHGGTINVESELGTGTTFTLYLPASEAKQLPETETQTSETQPLNFTAHVLVMDDDELISELLKHGLEHNGFHAEIADSGEQAIAMYTQAMKTDDAFDIIIMDLTIPGGMGGRETLQELLKIDPEVRAIVSSGYAEDPVMANYADYGFKGVTIKPSPINTLRDMIQKILHDNM